MKGDTVNGSGCMSMPRWYSNFFDHRTDCMLSPKLGEIHWKVKSLNDMRDIGSYVKPEGSPSKRCNGAMDLGTRCTWHVPKK